ncbi:hypothetical protein JCM33374_g324 [Metschnikowia sp. JCM 33374]|nr:hypothetical protein JCM33374_g324 [Metschnikowia sp. JCM 33374]
MKDTSSTIKPKSLTFDEVTRDTIGMILFDSKQRPVGKLAHGGGGHTRESVERRFCGVSEKDPRNPKIKAYICNENIVAALTKIGPNCVVVVEIIDDKGVFHVFGAIANQNVDY